MKIGFRTNKLEKQLTIAKEIQKKFGTNAKRVSQRMVELNAANNLNVLISIPAANCHMLSKDRKDEWALDISANHRILFCIDHNPIPLLESGGINTVLITDIVIIDAQVDYH